MGSLLICDGTKNVTSSSTPQFHITPLTTLSYLSYPIARCQLTTKDKYNKSEDHLSHFVNIHELTSCYLIDGIKYAVVVFFLDVWNPTHIFAGTESAMILKLCALWYVILAMTRKEEPIRI